MKALAFAINEIDATWQKIRHGIESGVGERERGEIESEKWIGSNKEA